MTKHLALLFLLVTYAIALDITVKAKQINNIVNAKVIIKHPMTTFHQAEQRTGNKKNAYFITHITAKINDNIVYDVSTSPFLSKNPVMKFNYTYQGRGNDLKIISIDNKKEINKRSTKIKNSSGLNELSFANTINLQSKNFRKSNPKLWQEISVEDGIMDLYGNIKSFEKQIKIDIQGVMKFRDGLCLHNSANTTIRIQSKVALTSLAVFQDMLEHPTIAVFNTPSNVLIDYGLNVKLGRGFYDSGNIIVVAKGDNGKYYIDKQKVYLANGTHINCDGSNDLD